MIGVVALSRAQWMKREKVEASWSKKGLLCAMAITEMLHGIITLNWK